MKVKSTTTTTTTPINSVDDKNKKFKLYKLLPINNSEDNASNIKQRKVKLNKGKRRVVSATTGEQKKKKIKWIRAIVTKKRRRQ